MKKIIIKNGIFLNKRNKKEVCFLNKVRRWIGYLWFFENLTGGRFCFWCFDLKSKQTANQRKILGGIR